MATFIPSKYQQAVYDHISTGSGNAVVDAVAGSGKSTTIINALKLIPSDQSVLFLAFNKAIVEELKIKIGNVANVDIRTLHSFGSSVLSRVYRSRIDANKYRQYINEGLKYRHITPAQVVADSDFQQYKSNIFQLIDLGRSNLVSTVTEIEEIASKHDLDVIDNECEVAMNAITWGETEVNIIDFADMIYLPNAKGLETPKFDWVFIDECQDLNAAQRELFLRSLKPTGRFVAVGDPKQSIYGFSGADVISFQLLKQIPNTISLPLSISYRCDQAIVTLAKTIVSQIEARDSAAQGEVVYDVLPSQIKDGDMVLCRITAPLVEMCMRYIANGTKAYVKGRDVGANLINMIKRTNRTFILEVEKAFDKELEKIAKRQMAKLHCSLKEAKETSIYSSYEDKVKAIEILSEGLRTAEQVMCRVETIFKDDEKNGICLSTIHKSKGLESDRVFILRNDMMYLKKAMQVDWMAEQERNLAYVAYTRAKHYLGFLKIEKRV